MGMTMIVSNLDIDVQAVRVERLRHTKAPIRPRYVGNFAIGYNVVICVVTEVRDNE